MSVDPNTESATLALAADDVQLCNTCEQIKPLDEFYPLRKDEPDGQRMKRCADCERDRVAAGYQNREVAANRLLRTRARNRATAALIRAHSDEFRNLLDFFTDAAETEAVLLAERARDTGAGELPRLRPGPRRNRQEAEDRIKTMWAEVGKCSQCTSHHSHDHACENCGHPQPGAAPTLIPDVRGTCSCPHPLRRHDEYEGCLIDGCECSGYPENTSVGAA